MTEQMYDFSVLRELRQREDLTINQVSEQAGVSAAVISRLERNLACAELPTLYHLARVFNMTATDLLGLAEQRSAHLQQETKHESAGFSFRQVRYGNLQLLYGQAEAGAHVSRPEIHHDDYELCWVLEGMLRLCLPNERFDLRAGEGVQFDAILGHTYEALCHCEFIITHLRKDKRF